MRRLVRALTLLVGLSSLAGGPTVARYPAPEPGFQSLFNGHDLSGWRLGNNILNGKTGSADGRFEVENGEIVVNAGKDVELLDTTRQFNHNFILKLEYRAAPRADSGLFIRGHQLQVRDYPRVGPYRVPRFKEGGWNELDVVVIARKAICTSDGTVLEKAFEIPATGSIALQAEKGRFEYRRIEVREQT